MKKPPIGIMPKYLWERRRFYDLIETIKRYLDAEKKIPVEWIEEYNNSIKFDKEDI